MDEKHTQQFAQTDGESAPVASVESVAPEASTDSITSSDSVTSNNSVASNNSASNEDFDFLSLLAGVQAAETKNSQNSPAATESGEENQISKSQETAPSSSKEGGEEKRRHHLWHRLSSNSSNSSNQSKDNKSSAKNDSAPHFTPLPVAPKSTDFGIFDSLDGQIFDSATRLRLHTLISTCLMNGIADSRVNAFMHLLQWPDAPKMVVIAGTFGTTITPDTGPNRKPAPTLPPDNTDALRRNIWPQLGSCNAYDAIVDRAQSSALNRMTGALRSINASTTNASDYFATPSHIILLAVRENPSEQSLQKMCQVFEPSKKPICISGVVEGVENIATAITSTLAAIAVAGSVKQLPQIIHADDVLPERALIGDSTAFNTLYNNVYQSLAPYSHDDPTLQTIDMFLRFGGALDQTAHELNVHPNTVRYRLRKVAQTTGWDATDPRAAYVLQTAITIGRIRDSRRPA